MSADKTYTLGEIKAAYFAEFHAVGEVYFDSSGTEEENRKSTDDSFEEFVFELDQAKLKGAGMNKWKVQVFGEKHSESWEISVIHVDNDHGQRSWGWFDSNKFLISHNGGPCQWAIPGFVFDQQLIIAEEVARRLNCGESIDVPKVGGEICPSSDGVEEIHNLMLKPDLSKLSKFFRGE